MSTILWYNYTGLAVQNVVPAVHELALGGVCERKRCVNKRCFWNRRRGVDTVWASWMATVFVQNSDRRGTFVDRGKSLIGI